VEVEERWLIAYFYTNNNKPMRETHIKMHITLFTHMAYIVAMITISLGTKKLPSHVYVYNLTT